jgi:hypothetical protein
MPKKLARNEWDFSKVHEDHYRAAWEWEFDRSAFLKGKRWLDLKSRDRKKIAEYFSESLWPIHEHNLECIRGGYIRSRVQALDVTSINMHLFDIDWSYSRPAIKKALSKWVDKNYTSDIHQAKRSAPILQELEISQKNPKGGRPPSYIGLLTDLAIYRLHNAGTSSDQGGLKLQPLAELCNIQDTPDNKFSAANWASAVRRIGKEIADRKTRHFRLMDIFDV